MTAWVVPTARAIGWLPLTAVGGGLVALSAVAAYADRWPTAMLGIASAAVAAGAVAGLRDEAASLLAAVPVPALTRLAHRLVLLVPAAVAVWLAYLWPGQAAEPGPGWPVAPMLALAACGAVVADRAAGWWGTAAGVAVPLLWAAAGHVAGPFDTKVAEVLLPWLHHPWLVITAATAALLWGRTR